MDFSGKEGHPNIQPSTTPGIEPGTSRLEGRDLYHCANTSAIYHDNVSVSFPARKSKIERKIAMKTWDLLKATYLIALLHISNENTAYLFEISRCIKYFKTSTKHLLCVSKGGTFD